MFVVLGMSLVTVGFAYTNLGLPTQSGVCGPVACVTLTIHVIVNGVGVNGANVYVTGPQSATSVTNSAGTATITNYPAAGAPYPATVNVNAYGYANPPSQTQTITGDTTFTFTLSGNAPPSNQFDYSFPIVSGYPTLSQGGGVMLTVQVTLLSGTAQTTTLSTSCPNGLTCNWDSNSGLPPFTRHLGIFASQTITPNPYNIPITASAINAAYPSKTTTETITVTPASTAPFDFSLTSLGGTFNGLAGAVFQIGFSVIVISGLPSVGTQGVTLSFTGTCPSGAACGFPLQPIPNPNVGCATTPVNQANCASTYTVYLSSSISSFSIAFYMSTSSSTPANSYAFTVAATGGGQTHTASVTFTLQSPPPFDFNISPGGTSQIQQGQTATINVPINMISGSSQSVTLSYTGCSSNAQCTLNPLTVTPNPYANSVFTFATTTNTPIGAYPLTFTGTGGGQTHSAPFTVNVVVQPPPPQVFDFTMTQPQPSNLSVTYPSTPSVTTQTSLALTSTATTTATVYFSVNVPTPGVTCSANPASGQPPFSATVTCTITTASATTGQFTGTITATGGGQTHTVNFNLQVSTPFDFQMGVSGPITVAQGGSGTATLTLTLTSGSPQPVDVTVHDLQAACPPQATCTLSPVTGTVPYTSTLTVTTSNTPTGSYQIVIDAVNTQFNKLREVQVPITVTAPSCPYGGTWPNCNYWGMLLPQIALIVSGLVSIIAGVVFIAVKPF